MPYAAQLDLSFWKNLVHPGASSRRSSPGGRVAAWFAFTRPQGDKSKLRAPRAIPRRHINEAVNEFGAFG